MKNLFVIILLLISSNAYALGITGSGSGLSETQLFSVSKGTFTCTSGGTITIGNANMQITSIVLISLNTAGGTISVDPAVKTITAGSQLQVLCAALDTSIYNYAILN
jgi:phage-related protein